MDPTENSKAVANELISISHDQGVDLEGLCTDGYFRVNRRWIFLWRKDELPSSGPVDEPLGTLHYSLQGAISGMPSQLTASAGAFQGVWSEAGTLESVFQAFDLVKAWLIDCKEVDDLPQRCVSRFGI